MSMPSSRLDVATTHGSCPLLSSLLHLPPPVLRDGAVVRLGYDVEGALHQIARRAHVRAHAGGGRGAGDVRAAGQGVLPTRRHAAFRAAGQKPAALRVQLVQPSRQLLAQAAGIHEHDGGAVRQHLVEASAASMSGQMEDEPARLSGDPAAGFADPPAMSVVQGPVGLPCLFLRRAPRPAGAAPVRGRPRHVGVGSPVRRNGRHVAHGNDHPHVQVRTSLVGHHADRPHAAQKARHLFAGAHGRGKPDALRGTLQQAVQALQAQAPGARRACCPPARALRPR